MNKLIGEHLIEEIKELEDKLCNLRLRVREYCDGYKYVTQLHCHGSVTTDTYNNEYLVQWLCDQYYGDNGVVHVYTTNRDHNISNQGGDVIYIRPDVIDLLSTTVPDDYHDSGSNSQYNDHDTDLIPDEADFLKRLKED